MTILDQPHELDSPAVISDEVGGETLAINLNTGAYFVIPPGALPVWAAVTQAVPARALLDGPDDPRAEGLAAYLQRLVEVGLVRPAATASEHGGPVGAWQVTDLELMEHNEMADLLGLDPIHDVDVSVGWPQARPADEQ